MLKMKLGVIGLGKMAGAIVTKLLKDGELKKNQLLFCNKHGRKKTLAERFTVRATTLERLIKEANVILIGVKPQNLSEILPKMAAVKKSQLILSIVSGKRISTYEKIIGKKKIIRIMPNAPALVGEGMSVIFADKNCSRRDKLLCEKIFSAVGEVLPIKNEKLLDAVTAVSGAGPAFVYKFAQGLIESGRKLGLSQNMSQKLVFQTLRGSVAVMSQTEPNLDELIQAVASKGGTTLAGLKALQKKKFTSAIEACIRAAHKRAKELGRE